MPLNVPDKFQFANYFGIRRKEGVFSTVDMNTMVSSSPSQSPCQVISKRLQLCENVSKNCQKGVTTTLIDPTTESQFCIPAGSVIHKWTVVDKTCGNLSCELSLMLGYLSECIDDDTRQAVLAQRVAGVDTQLTGTYFCVYHSVTIKDTLTSARLAAQRALYGAEDAENGVCAPDVDLGIINGDNYAAEPKGILPSITVTSGELCVNDLDFWVCYTPPSPGMVMKPVVVMQPCVPGGCGIGRNSGCGNSSKGCGSGSCGGRGGCGH